MLPLFLTRGCRWLQVQRLCEGAAVRVSADTVDGTVVVEATLGTMSSVGTPMYVES